MDKQSLTAILQEQLTRYPKIEVGDLYKLLHQAALGSEHAVRDEQAARSWLEGELREMAPGPDDPLLDPISPDERILRVHLRPYLRTGRDPETLLLAFVRTANEWPGSTETLRDLGAAAAEWLGASSVPLMGEAWWAFFAGMEAQGFPATQHSETYRSLYRPAYRVVASIFLEGV
ncbi:MAG: hypothetical protein ABIJ39_03310 [Chloroflexota bacterium]